MTRKEETLKEVQNRSTYNGFHADEFIQGVEWSDANPSEANIAMYLGKKGWPLSTYGVPTYEEAAKTLDEYYEYKRKQWIKKAKEWFEKRPEQYDANGVRCYSKEDFEDFLKTMKL